MKQYVCGICGYIHDEAVGGKWEDLPADWKCPVCKAGKDAFKPKEEKTASQEVLEKPHVDKELSPMEMSIICSNLARGCEKQYLPQQADDFRKLAEFFRSKAAPVEEASTAKLLELIDKDLSVGYPYGNAIAGEKPDRGGLRCQVWSEKVTRMLQSLLTRYESEGDKMLENTGVWVCTVCGFVYVGWSQKKEDLIKASENALHFYGGVPLAIVPDNLKSAVTSSDRHEPVIQEDFVAFAEHYGMAVYPARVRKPKDKALVENAVKLLYRSVYVDIKDREFHSLEELNEAIRASLERFNERKLSGRNQSRRQLFESVERDFLRPLPAMRHQMRQRKSVTVIDRKSVV